ncbi:DUF805 domain-containing protein [uncultured Algimonas sp.]|uniref:DUF805 domain-containing protein n=1 Tax=uncultured Algimonas sp. TaxID=1547920 RepID=UPI00261D32B2|nr:DUF805 domain-containing protein [uncultured Algimonas sp.]
MQARGIGFIEAIGLGFRNYFNFRDRARRSEYWWFMLFTVLGGLGFSALDSAFFAGGENNQEWFSSVFSLIVLIPGLALGWRRLHDIGKSGWWILLPYATLLWLLAGVITLGIEGEGSTAAIVAVSGMLCFFGSLIYVLVLLVRDSDPHENRYGPSPKYDDSDVFYA